MLYHYLEHKRKESSPQLHATYLVTGKFVDNGQTVSNWDSFCPGRFDSSVWFNSCLKCPPFQCHKVSIVREDQLEGVLMLSVAPSNWSFFSWSFLRNGKENNIFAVQIFINTCFSGTVGLKYLMLSFADFKSKMSLIVSVHVYSVQKALLKDSGPLYSVDYDAVKDHLKNCSKYEWCVDRKLQI